MVKKEDNSIHIGSNNKIKNSVIGQNAKVEKSNYDEKWFEKITWKLVVPVVVIVVAAAVCLWLGLN
mgnify:CR=1 FL=1